MEKIEYLSPKAKTIIVKASRIICLSDYGSVKNDNYEEDELDW